MAYQMIEDYSCIWPGGPTALDPKGFAIHWWGAGSPQFMPIVQLLVNRAAQSSASIHFVAEEGRVACLTSPFEIAWGQGDGAHGWGNRNLVSIECNPRCTPGDRETVAELIADQHIRNGIPIALYPHKKFTATQCPGVWEQWIPWLTERAKQIVNEKTNGKQEEEMPSAEEIARAVWSYNNGQAKDAYAFLRDIPKDVVYYKFPWNGFDGKVPTEGRTTTDLTQIGWLDTQFAGAYNLIRGHQSNPVELTEEDIENLAKTLKESLSAELAADLAKRLAE